jgi:hypothetical protein
VAQRVLAKPLVPVDDRRQFPARPLKDIDDALGLVEVLMKVFQRRIAHRRTPHPRGLLRRGAYALLDEDPLDDINADLAPSSGLAQIPVGLPRGDNGFYVGQLCGISLSVAGGALFDLGQPFEHTFPEPRHFGSNAFVAGRALTSSASSCALERCSLIEIQDECQKSAYHKHNRNQDHRCLLQYRIRVIFAMRGHYTR